MEHITQKKRNQNNDTYYISTEEMIVNLLIADQKKYLSISRLYQFTAYLRRRLDNASYLRPNARIIFDVSAETIERTVQYNSLVYDLVGDNIFLKGILPTITDDDGLLPAAAQDFVAKYTY